MVTSIFSVIQVFCALVLIAVVMSQTTKHEGMGGTIGGKAVSSFRGKGGFEEQLQKYTMYAAVAFFISSLFVAYIPAGK